MKFSIVNITILCSAAFSLGAPLTNAVDIDDLSGRSYYDTAEELDAREWYTLEPRGGPFHDAASSTSSRKHIHGVIKTAKAEGHLDNASAGGSSAGSLYVGGGLHIDRQQPTNAQGQHKVAIQLNKVKKGSPSTVGQVVFHGGKQVSAARVAKALKHSVTTGKETHINHPGSRKAKNTAINLAKQQAKAARVQEKYRQGMARAANSKGRRT